MNYKVVPFVAKITQNETTAAVAGQLQSIINQYAAEGWEYVRLENVETSVAGTGGCFGIGAKPAFNTTFSMVVFKQP
jgi:hypothetical protein